MEEWRGFTLIENMLGMMLLLVASVSVLQTITQDMVVGDVLWGRRVAVRFVESELERHCRDASTPANFSALGNNPNCGGCSVNPWTSCAGGTMTPLPTQLQNAVGGRCVTYLNAALAESAVETDLIRVKARITWTSRGHQMNETSEDYLITRVGLCSQG